MRMWGLGRIAARHALVLCAAFVLAACKTDGDPLVTGSIPQAARNTIAIDSIDGPPRPVFDRLVALLAAEAEARELPIVTRDGPSAYRARLYLAAELAGKQARLAWVVELYDREQRLFRLSGAEPAGVARDDLWKRVDDAALRRVAAKSLEAIQAAIGGSLPRPAAPETPRTEPAQPQVAFADPAR